MNSRNFVCFSIFCFEFDRRHCYT